MKRRTVRAGMLMVGIMVGTWCGASGVPALNPGLLPHPKVQLPDLVVKSVSVTAIHHPQVAPSVIITVLVRNIGGAASGPCMTSLYTLFPASTPTATFPASSTFAQQATPSIAPGAETQVVFDTYTTLSTCILMAMVDAPFSAIVGSPALLGKVAEMSELNNAFAMPFDNGQPLPQDFDNPAVP